MSVLLTVNIVSHNPARSSSNNIPSYLQTITITRMLSTGGEGVKTERWTDGCTDRQIKKQTE